jgi:hypothetical protein
VVGASCSVTQSGGQSVYVSWKNIAGSFVKNIVHQECCVKEEYTQQWKNINSRVQCWINLKRENLRYSQLKQECKQPK